MNIARNEYFNNTLPSSISAFTTSIDCWNYYNGATNTTLLPQFGANRNPDLASTRTGAMKKIIYPTGGTTEFEYELNEFGYVRENTYTNTRGTIGGLFELNLVKITFDSIMEHFDTYIATDRHVKDKNF